MTTKPSRSINGITTKYQPALPSSSHNNSLSKSPVTTTNIINLFTRIRNYVETTQRLQPARETTDVPFTVGFQILTSGLRITACIARPVENFLSEDVVKLFGALLAEFLITHGWWYGASEPSFLFVESMD
jgi:hypothetical protein